MVWFPGCSDDVQIGQCEPAEVLLECSPDMCLDDISVFPPKVLQTTVCRTE